MADLEDKTISIEHVEAQNEDKNPSIDDGGLETNLKRKWDCRILPLIFIIYFCSFMDRASIANASIAGLNTDLHLVGNSYNIALALFFVIYTVVDVPAAWIFPIVGRGRFLAICVSCWGIVTLCFGFIENLPQLYALRCLLGLFEGGLTTCIFLYVGLFYTRYELQKRIAWFYISGPLSNAVGGLLASGLGRIQTGKYSGWRWIFIVEGAFTVLIGFCCFFALPNWPSQARYLTAEEKTLAESRAMAVSNRYGNDGEAGESYTGKRAIRGILDQNTLLPALSSLGTYANIYAYTLFSPTIIKSFGFTTLQSQLLSAPPYVAAALFILATCYASDHIRKRGPFVILGALLQAIGWSVQLGTRSIAGRYFALFLIASGSFGSVPPSTAIVINNIQPQLTQATALAFTIGSGTCGGILTTFIYIGNKDYTVGNAVQLGLSGMTALCMAVLMSMNDRENSKRARGERDYRLTDGKIPVNELGSRHPLYKLSL